MRVPLAAGAVALVLGLVGCGSGGTPADDRSAGQYAQRSTTPAPTASAPTTSSAPGTVVRSAGSDFGPMLFDARKQAIYLFDKESTDTAECYGECARAWPPVLTDGQPQAAGAVDQALLGTTTRRDGSVQVTYNGHPLYYYAHEQPGQVLCHDVVEYGGRWLVVTPEGEAAPA